MSAGDGFVGTTNSPPSPPPASGTPASVPPSGMPPSGRIGPPVRFTSTVGLVQVVPRAHLKMTRAALSVQYAFVPSVATWKGELKLVLPRWNVVALGTMSGDCWTFALSGQSSSVPPMASRLPVTPPSVPAEGSTIVAPGTVVGALMHPAAAHDTRLIVPNSALPENQKTV